MKLIGKGWQYRVYDMGNGRVRKIERSILDSFCRALFTKGEIYFLNPIKSWKDAKLIRHKTRASITVLKRQLPQIPPELFGNPEFFGTHTYEQDKALLLR